LILATTAFLVVQRLYIELKPPPLRVLPTPKGSKNRKLAAEQKTRKKKKRKEKKGEERKEAEQEKKGGPKRGVEPL
jgi:hypothetical protein